MGEIDKKLFVTLSEQFFKMQANAGRFDFLPNWKRQLWGSDCVRKGEVRSLSRNRQTLHSSPDITGPSETSKMTHFFGSSFHLQMTEQNTNFLFSLFSQSFILFIDIVIPNFQFLCDSEDFWKLDVNCSKELRIAKKWRHHCRCSKTFEHFALEQNRCKVTKKWKPYSPYSATSRGFRKRRGFT